MGSAKVFRHRHKENVRKSLSWIKHLGMRDASRQCHSTFIIQSECTTIIVLTRGRLVRISFENQRPLPGDAERRSAGCVRTLQSTRKKLIASTTAFRSNLLCELPFRPASRPERRSGADVFSTRKAASVYR